MAEIIDLNEMSEATRRYVIMKFEGKIPFKTILEKIAETTEDELTDEDIELIADGITEGFPIDITDEVLGECKQNGLTPPDWAEKMKIIMTEVNVIEEVEE